MNRLQNFFFVFIFLIISLTIALIWKNQKIISQISDKNILSSETDFIEVRIGSATIRAEIADTPEERSRGLSGRERLPENQGILFIFEEPGTYGFWMAGMLFPIDIVWISEEKKVVGIEKNVPAPSQGTLDERLKVYLPPEPVLYVLETNTGWSEANQIKVGDIVSF
jgi:uncharacterized membrane protein (UPF0127 family)